MGKKTKNDNKFIDSNKIEDGVSIKGVIESIDKDYPLFCFKYLSDKSIKKTKDYSLLKDFIIRLHNLSQLGWKNIRKSGRHEYGYESIPKKEFSVELPSIVTDDVKELNVFRASSDNRVFIGLQERNIFHIFFVETTINDFYQHGK